MSVFENVIKTAIKIRRELHQHPELTWEEFETAKYIRARLDKLDIQWRECAKTGTVAVLNPSGKGQHIALRGDIDALPILEKTGQDWQSKHEGKMHACGHDGHAATLLATAEWLKANEGTLNGPVTLLFQPAEEGGHGAKAMIDEGALEGVDCVFGWHNWPAVEYGKMVCPDGILTCGNANLTITVKGIGGHASQPEVLRDPVLAAAAITLALQQIVSRRVAPQDQVVVSIASINARSASTIVPTSAEISGSIRYSSMANSRLIGELIEEISTNTAAAYGVSCTCDYQPIYGPTINHAAQAEQMRAAWVSEHGRESATPEINVPIMASEDFSYFLREVPGAFALIGADDGPEHRVTCHNDTFDFNDRLIAKVVRLYSRLVGAPTE